MCETQKRQVTEGKSTAGSKIHDNSDGEEESAALLLEGEVSLGELIWVKLHKHSWWPALVIDENSVSESSKPGHRSQGEVLVRLYGSYEYLYADPTKYHSEFKMILEQNNGSCYEILDKALEQDCSRRKSIKRKGEGSNSTANKRAGSSKGKEKLKQNQVKGNQVPDSNLKLKRKSPSTAPQRKRGKTSEQGEEQEKVKPNSPNSDGIKSRTPKQNKLLDEKSNSQTSEKTSPGNSPKSSARRMRVMQGLGLVAPPGSPFHKN